MIISHKHKFIFIKTKKTAGTSIEILLSKYCGENDIITPISPEDEKTRKQLGYKTAQNYIIQKNGETIKLHNHISSQRIIEIFGEALWREYYTFCFERNPWEKVISFFYYKNVNHREKISDFIRSDSLDKLFYGKNRLYLLADKIIVNKVYLYEDLENAIKDIFTKLNIKDTVKLPHAKTQFRKDKRNYKEILSLEDISYIQLKFKDEIKSFYPSE